MNTKFEHIEDIIARFLAGEASSQDVALLEEWTSLSPENAKEFEQMKRIFTESASLKNLLPVNTDAAWNRLKKSMDASGEKGEVVSLQQPGSYSVFLRIAAVFVLLAGLGSVYYFLLRKEGSTEKTFAAGTTIEKTLLPDGSSIILNRNSSIQYASEFSSKRVVKLKGEAFFDVKHDAAVPFEVEAGGIRIQDVGTSFNVKSYANSNIVIVSVVSGEVKMIAAEDKTMLLSAGEEASYNTETKILSKDETVDPNISAYKDKIFIFDNAQLSHVLKVLNDVYQSDLQIDNEAIASCRITVTFNNEPIDEIAAVIAETLGLTLKKENAALIFQGHECK